MIYTLSAITLSGNSCELIELNTYCFIEYESDDVKRNGVNDQYYLIIHKIYLLEWTLDVSKCQKPKTFVTYLFMRNHVHHY